MAIGISPTVDFAFKMMLGNPDHTRVTIHFLNALLDGPRITQVEILNPLLGGEYDDDKLLVLDILATDEHGRRLNIEMQTSIPAGLSQRFAFYVSRLYVEQLKDGGRYTSLQPAICICVLTKTLLRDAPNLHTDFRLRSQAGTVLTDDLQVHLLELSKLRSTPDNLAGANPIEQWAWFLINAERLSSQDIHQYLPDVAFQEAAEVLEKMSQTPHERLLYDARLKFQRDEAARLEYAQTEGLRQGREEGALIGRIQLLEQLLELPVSRLADFMDAGLDQLGLREQMLQDRLRSRGN